MSWFEELDRVAMGSSKRIASTRSGFHLVAKMETGRFQRLDARWKVGHFKDDPVPPARLLSKSAGHWPGPGCAWAAEDKLEMTS